MAAKTVGSNGHVALPNAHSADADGVKRRKSNPRPRKSENNGLLASLCNLICNHQLGLSVNLLLLLFLTHVLIPRVRDRTSKFLHLSYYNPGTGLYGCGTDDIPFVMTTVVVFTGVRVMVMEYFLDPLAKLGGIKTKKGLDRFKEQAWLIVYCTCSWSLGMYIMYHSDFWFNLHGIWEGWPFRQVDGLFKFYYLVQSGFWIQQILVVNIEEKRKDYAQMFTHHIFTVALMFLSYGYYHMRVGVVILCIMDLVDIVLPTAKLLKYLGYSTICDFAFGIFVITWFVTRHVFYMMVCWSIYAYAPVDMAPGCYFSDGSIVSYNQTEEFDALGGNQIWSNLLKAYTDQNGPICWNPSLRYYFLALLLALQVFCLMWFATILRIVFNVLKGSAADDLRSDDEGEDEEIEEETSTVLNGVKTGMELLPVEQEVGVESLTFTRKNSSASATRSQRRQARSSASRASGISIPGHSDHKELLGRIGCDKPT